MELAKSYSGQDVLLADFRTDVLGQDKFDGVWAIAWLLHVPRDEIARVLGKVHRSLKQGGVLLTSMQKGGGHEVSDDGRYFELYEPEEWEELLKGAGFTIERRRSDSGRRTTATEVTREVTWLVTLCRKT